MCGPWLQSCDLYRVELELQLGPITLLVNAQAMVFTGKYS